MQKLMRGREGARGLRGGVLKGRTLSKARHTCRGFRAVHFLAFCHASKSPTFSKLFSASLQKRGDVLGFESVFSPQHPFFFVANNRRPDSFVAIGNRWRIHNPLGAPCDPFLGQFRPSGQSPVWSCIRDSFAGTGYLVEKM